LSEPRTAVVALGGNAITMDGVPDTIANQFRHTRQSLEGVVTLARQGWKLAVTHGNGPQVGNAILRVEIARGQAPELPLGICVADTEGGMGYMIEQSLFNALYVAGVLRPVITVITQVVVDEHDPAVSDPSKFIGRFYPKSQALELAAENGWTVKPQGKQGWRRVVPSPRPKAIFESDLIRDLVARGTIVVCCGGGGIPVFKLEDGRLEGLDAVVDKDRASAVLAAQIHADLLLILTAVDQVCLGYGTDQAQPLAAITAAEAERHLAQGQFPPGSMGPKIEAALDFLRHGGREVVITSIPRAALAVAGHAGTRIRP
jgi:carbamate kinase